MGFKRWDVRVLKGWWQITICPRCSSSTIPFQWMCQRGSKSGKHLFTSQMSLFPSLLQQISPPPFQLSGQFLPTNPMPTSLRFRENCHRWIHHCYKEAAGGGFNDSLFSPLPGEMIQFKQYFSDGLKSPTRQRFVVQLYFADKERTPKPVLKVDKPSNMEEYQVLVIDRGRWCPSRKTPLLSDASIGGYMLRRNWYCCHWRGSSSTSQLLDICQWCNILQKQPLAVDTYLCRCLVFGCIIPTSDFLTCGTVAPRWQWSDAVALHKACCRCLPGWEQAAVNEPTWHFLFGIWSPKWMVNLLGVFQYTYSYNHIHVHIHINMNIWMWVWIDESNVYTYIYSGSYQS